MTVEPRPKGGSLPEKRPGNENEVLQFIYPQHDPPRSCT
jgi:hypothetical protein